MKKITTILMLLLSFAAFSQQLEIEQPDPDQYYYHIVEATAEIVTDNICYVVSQNKLETFKITGKYFTEGCQYKMILMIPTNQPDNTPKEALVMRYWKSRRQLTQEYNKALDSLGMSN